MLLIHGKRKARIKKYSDNHQRCNSCGSFDLNINVDREYYHLFLIPFLPVGEKTAEIKCNNCSTFYRSDALQNQYEKQTKTPVYLYTLAIIFCGLFIIVLYINLKNQKQKAAFVDDPRVGDVYLISKDENNSTAYSFLKVIDINDDKIITHHNNMVYNNYISELDSNDFFVKGDTLIFTKNQLKQMLTNDEINSVERIYGNEEGFNRIK